ncbi:MAG TPA: hypothetical protein VK641_14840, partial [Terriglobales bacterium]|nr:hypothetical protein [Terriglobales bacterium]
MPSGYLSRTATIAVTWTCRYTKEPSPYKAATITHIRATAYRFFVEQKKAKRCRENPVEEAELRAVDEGPQKERAILEDDEIAKVVSHPDVDGEIKVLLLISRTVGGLRGGDLNAMQWTAFAPIPGFNTCTFVRRKTRRTKKPSKPPKRETHALPEQTRAFVTKWWENHDKPTTGPVFPSRKGKRAGELKQG